MVKINKIKYNFPNGLPSVKLHFPLWHEIATFQHADLKGIYKGDFLYFRYAKREMDLHEKINVNPLILFFGADISNGYAEGVNLMLLNKFILPEGNGFEIKKSFIDPILNRLRLLHWNEIYKTGERKSFMKLEKNTLKSIFGQRFGETMLQYWRRYDLKKMKSVSNINIDTAQQVLEETRPLFKKTIFKG